MLGSPSFHSYRDASTGSGKPNLELGSGIYYEDQAYPVGQSWPTRAPVRRAIIPAKRSINSDGHDTSSSGVESLSFDKSSSNGVDDRVHNALLEELCADFGVTDSSYVDFLNFDVPADRVHSVQLPADLEELGEIVTFGTESVRDVSEGIHRTGSISGQQVDFLRPGVTTVKPSSGVQMRIPDDVASPTISSSCEESKPIEGGGEGLSDFPPTVHSTTGCASAKLDTGTTSDSGDDTLKWSSTKSDSIVKTEQKQVIPASTQLLGKQESSAISPTKDQQERNDSTASSPVHIAKRPRIIASGGDLLEDVKKSYAFVCGADMFSPPTQPAMSHPRLQAPVGSQNRMNDPASYSQTAMGYGARMSVADGLETPFQRGMQHRSVGQQPVADISSQSANFHSLTPGSGFHQRYGNEWQASPASVYHTNTHGTDMMGSGSVDFRPRPTHHMQHHSTGTGPDIRGPVPYVDGVPYTRTAEFSSHIHQDRLNYQTVNRSPRSYQSSRSHGYSTGPCGGTYQLTGRRPGSQQHEFHHNPLASPYHNPNATNAVRHRSVTTADGRHTYPTGYQYPPPRESMNANANYTEQGDHSSAPSPVQARGRSVTPGLVSSYPLQPGIESYMQDSNASNLRYASNDPATPTSRLPLMAESRLQPAPGVEKNVDFNGAAMLNERTFSQTDAGGNLYTEQRGNFPQSLALDRLAAANQMTPRGGRLPSYAEQSYAAPSGSLPAARAVDNGCHRFVRHLIGSGSGPYRSHPLFPLLRDLVIADMNFEAPSFPYPLIAGLPKSFDRLISNYFSCTSHSANAANLDPSVDSIVMDALRYAHSALLDKIHQRQLKESHQSDVPVSPVDSVCSQITQIGQLNNQERLQTSWTDLSQTGSDTSRYLTDQRTTNYVAPPSAGIEAVPPSPRHLSTRFQATDDSPARKAHYTLPSSPSAVYHGHEAPPQSSYLHAYGYSDMPLGVEKVSRSKVLPNEAKAIMTEWLRNHQDNPYPNDDEKEALMQSTKLTINQINYWFTNARRRLLPKWSMLRRNAEEAKSRCGSPIMTL